LYKRAGFGAAPSRHIISEMRYIFMALPFVPFISAVCVDWTWQKNKRAGAKLLAVLLPTNCAAGTFLMNYVHKKFTCPSESFVVPALVREIHLPVRHCGDGRVSARECRTRDTVFVDQWRDSPMLPYYLSGQLIFCYGLGHYTRLPGDLV